MQLLSSLSFLLFGLFFTGNAELSSFMTKSDLSQMLERTKNAITEFKDDGKNDSEVPFPYIKELCKQTILNMPEKVNDAHKRLQQLPEDSMNANWMILTDDIVQLNKQITDYHNNRTIEELKLRYLALAVFQCYKYDPRLPDASGIVEMVRISVLTGKPISEHDSELSKVKLLEFFDGNVMTKMSKEKIDSLEPIWDRWWAANDKVVQSFEPVKASLPMVTEEGLNQALLYLAEYYRVKYRLWRFNDEVGEITKHIAAGDKKVDSILLPVPKARSIHSEL